MPINWVDVPDPNNPPPGAPALSKANLDKLAVVADIGVAGTPTGDAGRSAYVTRGPAPSGGDDTTALNAALAALPGSGGILTLPAGTYHATSLTVPNNATIHGAGMGTVISYTGAAGGTLINLDSKLAVRLVDVQLQGPTTASASFNLVVLSNSFACEFRGVQFLGGHNNAGATQAGSTGVALRNNAGDNHFIGCRWNNLGAAVRTSCIQNYIIGANFIDNQRGIWGDEGNFGAGIVVTSSTFTGTSPAAVIAHIEVDVNANAWRVTDCWFEGCQTAVIIGNSNGDGPSGFQLTGCSNIAATNVCVDIRGGGMHYLSNNRYGFDAGATPVEIQVGTNAGAFGVIINQVSGQNFTVNTNWPAGWTVIDRDHVNLPMAFFKGNIGFFNKFPVSQQATPSTLAGVISLLQAYGLCP